MATLTGGRRAASRRFRAARAQKGLSQTAAARAAGVDRHVVVRFENGKTWPDALTQAKLEPVVGMPAGELEDIAARYIDDGDVIEEETSLRERLTNLRKRPSMYPSRNLAAEILDLEAELDNDPEAKLRWLEAQRDRIDAEIDRLRRSL